MPQTLNGIGTWYWGKDRIHRHNARCEHCGNFGQLSSYDTTLFFVVVFIPIIPLGRKRVINDCPRCRKHGVMPLKKWTQLQESSILEADRAAMAEPNSEVKAAAAVGASVGFDAQEEFDLLSRKYGDKFPRGPLVQAVIGDGYVHFGKTAEAEKAFLNSLAGKDDPQVHEALAVLLVRTNRPAEAEQHTKHVIDQKLSDRQGLPQLVAAGYQAQGKHDEALRLLESAQAAFPQLTKQAEFNQLVKVSQKHRETGKAVKGKLLGDMGMPSVKSGGWMGRLPRLIPTAILAIAVAWYLGTAIKLGISRPVHVVNGLDRPYVADINGTKVSVGPGARQVVNVPEGDLTIQVMDVAQASVQNIRISTPFWKRPFDSTVHVINPDGTALLVREQMTYSEAGTPSDEPYTLYVADFYHAIPSVDYVFEPFPSSVRLSSGAKQATKTRLDADRDLEFGQVASVLLGRKDLERCFALVRNRLAVVPEDETALLVAVQYMPSDQVETLLKPRLSIRPILLQWHRAYQELMERAHPEANLVTEYDRLLKAEPDSAELAYLLGRVTEDRSAAKVLFDRATRAPKPVGYAYHALAYEALIHAEFETSLDNERKAIALSPENDSFKSSEDDILMALGRYDELLREIRAHLSAAPLNGGLVFEELYLMARKGDFEGAAKRATEYQQRIRPETTEQQLVNVRSRQNAMLAYVRGEMAEYHRNLRAMPGNLSPFEAGVELRNFNQAMQSLQDAPGNHAESYAVIYLAATSAKDDATAKLALDAAVKEFAALDKTGRMLAGWIRGESAPTEQQVIDLSLPVSSKRIVLALVGQRFPAVRAPAYALAKKLNYHKQFPAELVDRMTTE